MESLLFLKPALLAVNTKLLQEMGGGGEIDILTPPTSLPGSTDHHTKHLKSQNPQSK